MNFGFTIATGTSEVVSNPAFIAAGLAAVIMLATCFRRRYRSVGSLLWRHGLATAATLGLLFVTIVDSDSATKASFNFYVTRPAIQLHLKPKPVENALAENSCIGRLAHRATIPVPDASDWSSRWSALTDLC
jgi:hypothetical protein